MKVSPPAFPTYIAENMAHGLSMRDYFAAAAMQAIMNSKFYSDMSNSIGWQEIAELNNLAEECYGVADAMMEARNA